MKIALIQHDVAWEDPEENFLRVGPLIAEAARAGARLAVLPEMFATGFSMAVDRVSEPPDGPITRFLVEQATSLGMWVAGSKAERAYDDQRARNTLLLVDPEGTVQRYDKLHPFRYAREHLSYEAGRKSVTFPVEGIRVTPFICYDLRFADCFWSAAPMTDLYLVVANWPAARAAHWSTLVPARAVENQAFVAAVNRVGEGGGVRYAGGSLVVGPWGETLVEAPDREGVFLTTVERDTVEEVRTSYPFLADR